jgi:DNA polymerase-3 subunit delta
MIVLLHGPDEYRRSERLHEYLAAIPEAAKSLNISRIEGKRFKLDAFIQASEAFPFLHDRRTVIVEDLLKNQKAGKERDEFKLVLERLPAWCDVIFVENEDIDKRGALYTHLIKIAQVEEFPYLKETDIVRWLGELARTLRVTIDNRAAYRLLSLVGNNGRTLLNEMTKLATYVRPGGAVDEATVDLLVADDTEENMFAFVDALAARRKGLALTKLRHLIADGQAPIYIIFMIARQVRILLQVRELDGLRLRPNEIATRVGLRPGFLTDKAIEQARGFSPADLERLHERVLSLDHKSKTGGIDVHAGLDLLVMET